MTSRGHGNHDTVYLWRPIFQRHISTFAGCPMGVHRRFVYDKTGLKALIKWLAAEPVERIVYEPTGRYHRSFERRMTEAGFPLSKVNPRQARRFAESIGALG